MNCNSSGSSACPLTICFFVLSHACILCRLASALLVVIPPPAVKSWFAWSAADHITAQRERAAW